MKKPSASTMLLAAEGEGPAEERAPSEEKEPKPVKKKRTLHPAMVAHQFKKKGA